MSANSNTERRPSKPYPDFPLFPHATGRWAKKIRGRFHYFGPWEDAQGALKKYLDQRDDLHAGRIPRSKGEGLTLSELCNRYLTAKKLLADSGKIQHRTWHDNHKACARIIACFGRERMIDDLRPGDFERLRADLSRTMGLRTLKTEMQRVRSVFRYGYDAGLIDKTIRFGPAFRNPSRRSLAKLCLANGSRMFEADEIRKMLDAANPQLRAMILLGVNCGFGNIDCASLLLPVVDLDVGWVNHPRPKTAIPRRCPLWGETIRALEVVIALRPRAKDPANADLLFLTKYGNPYVRVTNNEHHDNLGYCFRELLVKLKLWRLGRGFYALRHTFRTVADEARDQPAVDHVMGHSDTSMASHYRERIGAERLRAVTDHVRKWLFETLL